MVFRILKTLINGVLAPFGYLLVNGMNYEKSVKERKAQTRRIAKLSDQVERLREQLAEGTQKLNRSTKKLDQSRRELEELRLKLQQAVRADLERQFRHIERP